MNCSAVAKKKKKKKKKYKNERSELRGVGK
jgi:hypothetical protein